MGLLIIVSALANKEFEVGFPKYGFIVIPSFLWFVPLLGFIYHYFWLKKRLKIGFSPTRTLGNYFTKSNSYGSNALTIIFVCSMIGGPYWLLWSGARVSVSILFSYAFTQLLTEVGYLCIWKQKGRNIGKMNLRDNPTLWDLLWKWLKGFSLKKLNFAFR